jgi:beta-phosphoglucomutase-like phosphatase (HAD superfamily)
MVKRGKPAPDLFLHAAGEMGLRPENCLVVEDSPAGVEAAKAAGMRVFGFTGGSHAHAGGLAKALAPLEPNAIFDDMRLLPSLVAALDMEA